VLTRQFLEKRDISNSFSFFRAIRSMGNLLAI